MIVPSDIGIFKQKALQWAATYHYCCYLDSNQNHVYGTPTYDLLIGVSNQPTIIPELGKAFSTLQQYHDEHKTWLFACLTYDLKNELERLSSNNPDQIQLPVMAFFEPEVRIEIQGEQLTIFPLEKTAAILQQIDTQPLEPSIKEHQRVEFKARFTKDEYTEAVEAIKEHIAAGDIYEMNLCQEFYAESVHIMPVDTFIKLNKHSKAPFSSFVKLYDKYLLCASPERYLKKTGNQLVSQPIKGTIKRGGNEAEEMVLKQQLLNDVKERAENVMIVDLVRNDFARVCLPGSVKVDELFGIYTFPQLHHMVSTVSGTLKPAHHWADAIKASFPMGSMTGAPKIMAMQLIEQYERTKRGLYSGAVGYITPEGDFDFNVVIRSLVYNAPQQYLCYQVGGAITYHSIAENEYAECMLKAEGMKRVFEA